MISMEILVSPNNFLGKSHFHTIEAWRFEPLQPGRFAGLPETRHRGTKGITFEGHSSPDTGNLTWIFMDFHSTSIIVS